MVFVFHIISYICDSMSKRDRKSIGSGAYMGFIGVRLSTKRIGFCFIGLWYTLFTVQYMTVQYSSNNIQ